MPKHSIYRESLHLLFNLKQTLFLILASMVLYTYIPPIGPKIIMIALFLPFWAMVIALLNQYILAPQSLSKDLYVKPHIWLKLTGIELLIWSSFGIIILLFSFFDNNPYSLVSINSLFPFLCCLFINWIIMRTFLGTWIPAIIANKNTHLSHAINRGNNQFFYIASRSLLVLPPAFLLVFLASSAQQHLYSNFGKSAHLPASLLSTTLVCFALLYTQILSSIILARAYHQSV